MSNMEQPSPLHSKCPSSRTCDSEPDGCSPVPASINPHRSDSCTVRSVAICTVGELFGGVERHVLGLLQGFRAAGIAAQLILFHDAELSAQAAKQGDVPAILPEGNIDFLATVRRLADLLRSKEIRLVHVHGYKAGVFCALARLIYRFSIVKTEHGLPEPLRGNQIRGIRDRAYRAIDILATQAVRASICYVSRDLQTYYRHAHFGLPKVVIANGVAPMEPTTFPRPKEYASGVTNLAIIGRLDPVKGHEFAIRALAMPAVPANIELHIVGNGPDEDRLRSMVADLDLSPRVHFLGFRRDIYDFIAHCDVLLMPSLHEGLPYTLIEGMALGRAIVASRVGGLSEVLEDGKTAVLAPPGDVSALAAALQRVSQDDSLRRSLGEHARSVQRERYSLEAMSRAYLSIYQHRLATGRS